MPAKLDRCVKKVKARNRKKGRKVSPYAVCAKSTGWVRKKGSGWKKKK